jgi:hypothetical protein
MDAPNLELARENAAALLAPVSDPSESTSSPAPDATQATDAQATDASDDAAVLLDRESLETSAFLLVTIAAEIAARRFGPKWAITEQRAWRIARPLTKVALKYCPALEGNGPELELGIAVGDYVLAGLQDVIADMGRDRIASATVTKVEDNAAATSAAASGKPATES